MEQRSYTSTEPQTGTYGQQEKKILSLAYLPASRKTYILLDNHKVYEIDQNRAESNIKESPG